MRNIAYGMRFTPEAEIFYAQGKFMEDFEDDFVYRGEFSKYFSTYQSMNDAQLRGYFSWRSQVRRGLVEKTLLSFAFVYIYELLNQIGVNSPDEGYHRLKDFWLTYRDMDAKINGYVKLWLQDYVVYNNLDKSLLNDCSRAHADSGILSLFNYKSHSAQEVFVQLNSLSSYNLQKSKFFKHYPDDVENVVYRVFSTLSDNFRQSRRGFGPKLFGRICITPYHMFQSAVFYHRATRKKFSYEINDLYRYRYQNGRWSCERLFCYGSKNTQIGELLRAIDFLMRRKYNFKSRLTAGKLPELFQDIIKQEIDGHMAGKRLAAAAAIEVDVSRLQDIRKAALNIQNRLTVEETEAMNGPAAAQADREDPAGLNDLQYQFLHCLLYGGEYDDLLRARGLLPSVLIDAINENLLAVFDDTVIIYENDRPAVLADYEDALKKMVTQ
ncbi:MAG: TerB N-terminal domain-containing protein [Desulfarculales bacterium]|nr:TerB N-terminal domain-containing protein [Desulfarculales bacterium]